MKRNGKILAFTLVLILLAPLLISCSGGPEGTYVSDGLIKETFTFREGGQVVMSAFGLELEGTYVIEDHKLIITYSLFGFQSEWENTFFQDGDSIFIDGTEFKKVSE